MLGKIGVIDYGMGNLKSVANALEYIGAPYIVTSDIGVLMTCEKLILPGVGAFQQAIEEIRKQGIDTLLYQAFESGKPLLGICLGMQLLVDSSYENGKYEGLGIIPGTVTRIEHDTVPQMGWNKLEITKESPLFEGLNKDKGYMYFVHSYRVKTEKDYISSYVTYGDEVTASIEYKNAYALQFHPEKSGEWGLKILENFAKVV